MKTRITLILTCFILIKPLSIWLYYQHIYPQSYDYFSSFNQNGATYSSNEQETEHDGFPTIYIKTSVDEDPTYEDNLWIASNFTFDGFNSLSASASDVGEISSHKNGTWNMLSEKISLYLRFEEQQPFFGEATKTYDWILLANASDRSLLRNYSALHLSRQLSGLDWVPLARPVHLYINDDYIGVYLLTQKRTSAHQYLGLATNSEPEISDYFFELNWQADHDDTNNTNFIRVNSQQFGVIGDASEDAGFDRDYLYEIIYPEAAFLTNDHQDYLQSFLTYIGNLMRDEDFEALSRLVDIGSFIDFYLVQEIFKNKDAGFENVFLHVSGQGTNRRLHHGSPWDFDQTAGNAYSLEAQDQTPFGGLYVAQRHYWYWYLIYMPEFFDLVVYRWNSVVRNEALLMIDYIGRVTNAHHNEFERDFNQHDILDQSMWSSPEHLYEIQTFAGHVTYLTEFLTARVHYLDDIFNGIIPRWRWQ